MPTMKTIEVVAAIIFQGDQVLCVQRAPSKYPYTSLKYEFPGGKIEANETQEEALKREILEELSMEVEVREQYLTIEHAYPDFSIIMHGCREISSATINSVVNNLNFKFATETKGKRRAIGNIYNLTVVSFQRGIIS